MPFRSSLTQVSMDKRWSFLLFFAFCGLIVYFTTWKGTPETNTFKHEAIIQPKIVKTVKTYSAFSKFNVSVI